VRAANAVKAMTPKRLFLPVILVISVIGSIITFFILRNQQHPSVTHLLRKSRQHQLINIPYYADGNQYSNFRCVGDNNDATNFESRSCVWVNVCYDTKQNNFYYYQRAKRPVLFDKNIGPIYTFKPNGKGFVTLNRKLFGLHPFGLDVVIQKPPDESSVHRLKDIHVVWRHSAQEHNFGHLVFEDFANIYHSFLRLGTNRENAVLMHKTGIPTDNSFKRIEADFRPAITPVPSVSLEPYLKSFGKQYVCFDYLQASSPVMPYDPISHTWNHGKEDLFYTFRNAIIAAHGLNPEAIPTSHKIIITKKLRSNLSRKRNIANLDAIAVFLQNKYPTIPVEIVEWDLLSAKEQIMKALGCTILITPCGGVSFILPFLPHGAHAIVMDYFSGPKVNDEWRGISSNQSVSMEGSYWNHYWHFKALYYQVFEPSDYKWDTQDKTNYRQQTSVVIKESRIATLVDTALEQMERQ
jgi:hypothetical protein